jgi:hypothetical protein
MNRELGWDHPSRMEGLTRRTLLLEGSTFASPAGAPLGPDKMDEFDGAVRRCLAKYERQRRKPSKRVPEDSYRTGEMALGIYFTTARYTGGADDARRDVILVDGLPITIPDSARNWGVGRGRRSLDRRWRDRLWDIAKPSQHGLGHLVNPVDLESAPRDSCALRPRRRSSRCQGASC